jgi:CRISPR-associated protein Cmr3
MSITIELDAIDTLFFRDGKPFSMGEETWADGIFPPPPSVIYGALRTAYFAEHIDEYKKLKANGNLNQEERDITLSLKIVNSAFRIANNTYFPIPQDLVKRKSKKKELAFLLTLDKSKSISNSPVSNCLIPLDKEISGSEIESIDNGLVTIETLCDYLNANSNSHYYKSLSDWVSQEPKIGIGKNNETNTSSDSGMLYRVGMNRLKKINIGNKVNESITLGFEIEGISVNSSFMRLGGEGKAVKISNTDGFDWFSIEPPELTGKTQFKVYLSTPALFKSGWLPDFSEKFKNCNIHASLMTAAIGRPIHIGGFDMKNNRPKPMLKATPPGSVYYYKTEALSSNQADALKSMFQGKSVSDFHTEQGFGIAYLGRVMEGNTK